MPVPTITSLNNAALDLAHMEVVATSPAANATDRLGNSKMTLAGAVASIASINVRGAWAASTVYAIKDVVLQAGTYYICVSGHTSSGTFAADSPTKWRIQQGVIKAEQASESLLAFGGVADGVTSNAAALAAAESGGNALIAVPDGVFALPDATTFAKEYTGPGKFSFGGVEIPMTRKGLMAHVIQDNTVVLGDLAQFYASIIANSSTVVLCGDSIGEGVSQTTYEDSFFSLFAEDMRRKCPGVTWAFQNLSLSGMDIGAAQSVAYVGGASDDFATIFNRPKGTAATYPSSNANMNVVTGNVDLWPNGSTLAKTWRDHLRDALPDLLIIEHGQNIPGADTAGWAVNCKALIAYARTWAKVPSIAIITACPATRKQAAWRATASNIQGAADTARGVALETNCTLLDANRQYLMLRDGIDNVNLARRPVPITGYPTNWSGMAPMPTLGGTTLTWASAGKIYNNSAGRQCKDLHYTAQFTPAVTGQTLGLIYRSPGANGYEVQVSGAFIRLYWGTTVLSAVGIVAMTAGTTHQLDVICIGARHQAYLNGVKVIDIYDYNSLLSGGVGVEMNGAGTVGLLSQLQGIPRVIGAGILTEDELLGVSPTEYTGNPTTTKGGDGIHHPSFMIGHYSAYYAACLGLVDAATRVANRPSASTATIKSIAPNAGNNAIGPAAPNAPTSYLSSDGYIQLSGGLTPNGATTIAAGATAATLNIAHVPNREVNGVAYIAGVITYCRVLANGNIIFGANVTSGQLANIDNFRFRQNN